MEDKQYFVDPSSMARRVFWHVYSVGTISIHQADHHEPFEKPGAHLFWVRSGTGRLESEGGQYQLRQGGLLWFVDMSKPRTYVPEQGGRLTISGIRFGGPGLEFWQEIFGGPSNAEFMIRDLAAIKNAQRDLIQLVRREPIGWEWQVHLILTRVLGELLTSRGLLRMRDVEVPAPVVRVLNAVAGNPARDWKARELAAIARVSYSGLRALFQACRKETLHTFIQRTRLDQARLLLADPRLSIKEVAERLNFSSEFYFSHFFRKATGKSPSDFRRQLQLKQRPP